MANYAKHETEEIAKIVREAFSYDPETGILMRIKVRDNRYRRFLGRPAGWESMSHEGVSYIAVRVGNLTFSAHRVCWLLLYGEWPSEFIDHEDGNGLNNKASNLKTVSSAGNSRNRRKVNPSSGHTGVTWRKSRSRWLARITVDRKIVYLGMFEDINDAISARKRAKVKYGFSERHGE